LSRLIEECREEEDRLSIMDEMQGYEGDGDKSNYQIRLPTA
jgi:hypothetical protein